MKSSSRANAALCVACAAILIALGQAPAALAAGSADGTTTGTAGVTATGAAAAGVTPTVPASQVQASYQNPLRRIRKLYAKRIDEGVDYSGSGPVKALGNAIITLVARGTSHFWAHEFGNVVVEQLQDGPLAGISVYNAENCTPDPKLYTGQQVTAATTICLLHNRFPYMELGFARNDTSGIPAAWNVYRTVRDGSKTAYGLDFSHLLGDLGAPQGNTNHGTGDQSYRPRKTIGKLPAGFPRF